MRRDCTTPIFSEPLNENNDKHVDKLQTICKLCSILPRVNFNVRVSAPQKKQTTLNHGAWDPPGSSVLAPTSLILTISDVNKLYMSKHCSVIIYLFVLVGGGVISQTLRYSYECTEKLNKLHLWNKVCSHWVQALPQSSTYAITMFSKQTARHSEFTKNQYNSSKSLRKRDRNLIHSSREVLKWNKSKQNHLKFKSKKRRENRLPWNPITSV